MSVTPRRPLAVQPHPYIGDVVGRPLDRGMIYFGEPDKDPQDYPITVYLDPEQTKPAHQPIRTKGGFINVFGDITEIFADEILYSLKVLDCYGRLVFYKKRMHRDNITEELGGEIVRAQKAESALQSSIDAETTRAKASESNLNIGLAKEVSDRESEVTRLDKADAVLQAQINSVGGGKLAYKTYAEMVEDKSNIVAKSSIDILADTDDKNGTYLYDGTNFVKSQYDLEKLIRAKVQNTFGTYDQMVASNLSDGAYALVADDVDANNGIYIKEGGLWVKSRYNSSAYVESLINKLESDIIFEPSGNIFDGQFVGGFIARSTANGEAFYQYVQRPVGEPLSRYKDATSAIIEVEGNTQYTIRVFDDESTNSFRISSYKDRPELIEYNDVSSPFEKGYSIYYDGASSNYVSNRAKIKQYTFTTRAEDRYVLMTFDLINSVKPKLSIVKGDSNLSYAPSKVVSNIKNLHTTLESLPFLLDSPKNLFDGNYKNLVLTNVGSSVLKLSPNISASRGKTAIIPVKPNTTYTVRTHSAHGRFRAALAAEYPTFISELYTLTTNNAYVNSDFVFTTNDDSKYLLVYVSTENETPLLQVEEGVKSTPYSSNGQINADRLRSLGLQTERSVNLFDSKVSKGVVTTSGTGVITLDTSKPKNQGCYTLIKINPSQPYAIKLHTEDSSGIPFNIAFLDSYLDMSVTTTATLSKIDYQSTNFKEVVLTAPSTAQYMLIQSPYLGYGNRLQVEKGATHTAYKEYFVIPDEKLSVTSSDNGAAGLFSPKRSFMFNADLNQLYRRGRVLDDYFTTPTAVKPDEVYARYDAIMAALPVGFMTKKALGVDDFGNTIYEYETNPTVLYEVQGSQNWVDGSPNNIPIRQPAIYLTSGMHGNEKTAVFGLMYALTDIYLNPTNNPLLDYISRTVKMIFCPIINPSGFIANTRRNGNNVDINRDFAPSGVTTQAETPIIKQALADKASMLDYQIECHTSFDAVPKMLGYVLTDEPELSFAIPDMYQQLGREMQKEFPQLNQDPYNRWVYKAQTVDNTFFKYAQNTLGLRGVTLETKNNIAPISSSYHHSENVVFYSELVVNTIIIMMRCLQRG